MSTKIAIAKYNDVGKPIWNPTTYHDNYVDKILFSSIVDIEFPLLKYATEVKGGVKQRLAGDFSLSFTYIGNTLSDNSESILGFFRGGSNNYIFWLGIEIDGIKLSGRFHSDKIYSDFTITEGKFGCTILVKDFLYDWAEYAATKDCVFNIDYNENIAFEDYVATHHLNQLVYDTSQVIFPDQSVETKTGGLVRFIGTFYREIGGFESGTVHTDWGKTSRMVIWEELSKGFAFDYDIVLNTDIETIYNSLDINHPIIMFYNVVIKWKSDIYNEEPYVLTRAKVHRENIIPLCKKYVFIGYRHHIYPGLNYYTIINGILYSNGNVISTDTLNFDPTTKPYFQIDTGYDSVLNYLAPNSGTFVKYIRNTEVIGIDLNVYTCNEFNLGANYIKAGAIAYSRLFCDPVTLQFDHVQRFAVLSYARYSSSFGLKGKEITTPMTGLDGINLYKPVQINDGNGDLLYEVDQIDSIDKKNNSIALKLVQLPNLS